MPEEGRYRMVRRLATILRVPPSQITKAIEARKGDPLTPITVRTSVPADRAFYLEEHRAEFPGVKVVTTFLRHYEHKSLAAQILGHVGEISEGELKAKQDEGYRAGDRIGKTGVEAAFDEYLRGPPGRAQLRVNSLGEPQSQFQVQQIWVPGNGVRLTLDIRLQRAAENAITYGIEQGARERELVGERRRDRRARPARRRGARARLEPDLQAVALRRPDRLRRSSTRSATPDANFPLINRATSGRYPPGSTWKPVTALAAMQENLLSPYQSIQCTPYSVYGRDRQVFNNWNPNVNEPMTLPTALAASCDTYFYEVGNRFYNLPERRGQPLQNWARTFGFGEPSGLDVGGEDSGLLPTYPLEAPDLHEGALPEDLAGRADSGSRATRSSSRSARRTCS